MYLEKINKWTDEQKMRLNVKKTKTITFNFTRKHQFTTKLKVSNVDILNVTETKLLGTVITNNLSWKKNTKELVIKGFRRMQLLNAAAGFTDSREDLKGIYLTYVRSVVEQSAVVWHSSLTQKNRNDLERVQKAAVRVIMGKNYISYKNSLKELKIDSLEVRREKLCISFAKKCIKNEKVKDMFPLKKTKHQMKKRKDEKFQTFKARTKRYKNSALPYMRRLLNTENEEKNALLKKC